LSRLEVRKAVRLVFLVLALLLVVDFAGGVEDEDEDDDEDEKLESLPLRGK
jgi:hypothetical protein